MVDTSNMCLQSIEAYKDGEFIGYVGKVFGQGTIVYCNIGSYKFKFPQKKAISVLRSARVSTMCVVKDGPKFPTQASNVEFKMVDYN